MVQVASKSEPAGKGMAEKLKKPANRREFPRYAAKHSFTLSFIRGDDSYRCRILDISLSGALLFCPGFEMDGSDILFADPKSGDSFHAKICWHRGERIGVEFDFSPQALDFVSSCLQETLFKTAPEERL